MHRNVLLINSIINKNTQQRTPKYHLKTIQLKTSYKPT